MTARVATNVQGPPKRPLRRAARRALFVVAVMLALAAVAGSASASPLYSMSGNWEPASVKGTAGLLELTMGESGTLSGKGSLGAAEVTSAAGLETSGGAVVVSLTESGGLVYTGIGELGDSGECFSGIDYDTDYATSKQLAWFVFVRQGSHPSLLETGNPAEPYVCAGTPDSGGHPPYSLSGSWVPASGAPAPNASWSMDALGNVLGRGESEGGPTVVWGHLGESGNLTLLTGKPESPGYASFLTGTTGDNGTCISGSSIDTRGFKESAVFVLAQDLGHVGLLNGGHECAGNSGTAKVGVSCSVFDPGTAGEYLQCTATVADATGEEPPRIPTGTVTFASPSGGFPEGAACALGVDPTSQTAFCAVRYVPAKTIATGATVAVSASYSGDSYFNPASGSAGPTVASATSVEHQVSLVPPQELCTAAIPIGEPVLYGGGATASAASLTISPFARLSVAAHAEAPVAAPARRARRISPAAIRARALAILDPRARRGRGGIAIYRLPSPLRAGATVSEGLAGATSMRPVKLHDRAWIYWADLAPGARFGHPSVLLLLDARSGRIVAQQRLNGYPRVSGRPVAFVHARHPRRYVVYAHLPHVRIASSAGKRILAARKFAAHEAAVWRSRAHRAATTAKAALITLVSQEKSEPFAAEGQAISGVFSSNGIPTYAAKTQGDLRTVINEATAAGARNVTLFLDSHGTSPEKTRYYKEGSGGTHERLTLTELLALDPSKLPPNVKTETYIGEPELLLAGGGYKPAELKTFIEEHPEVKFNIIITACYSGAFIPTLSTVSNVTSVTTSSSGNEPTVGGYDEETVNGVNVTLTAPPGVRSDIAPFVAAETYALQQAFTAAGPSVDVAGVVKTAQQTEAQYDAGAITGLEHPSVPWVTTQTGSGGAGTRGCNAPMEPDGEVDATASPVSPTGEANA